METIFDHNVTKNELELLFGFDDYSAKDFENDTKEQNISLIVRLHLLRKNMEKAAEYSRKLPDTIDKIFTLLNHDFC